MTSLTVSAIRYITAKMYGPVRMSYGSAVNTAFSTDIESVENTFLIYQVKLLSHF